MGFIIGSIILTLLIYGLIGLILKVKKNQNFILVGSITWLLSAALYGFGSLDGRGIEFFPNIFLNGLMFYFIGSAIWTMVAAVKFKNKK